MIGRDIAVKGDPPKYGETGPGGPRRLGRPPASGLGEEGVWSAHLAGDFAKSTGNGRQDAP